MQINDASEPAVKPTIFSIFYCVSLWLWSFISIYYGYSLYRHWSLMIPFSYYSFILCRHVSLNVIGICYLAFFVSFSILLWIRLSFIKTSRLSCNFYNLRIRCCRHCCLCLSWFHYYWLYWYCFTIHAGNSFTWSKQGLILCELPD